MGWLLQHGDVHEDMAYCVAVCTHFGMPSCCTTCHVEGAGDRAASHKAQGLRCGRRTRLNADTHLALSAGSHRDQEDAIVLYQGLCLHQFLYLSGGERRCTCE